MLNSISTADIEMLPSTMGWDTGVVATKVSLFLVRIAPIAVKLRNSRL